MVAHSILLTYMSNMVWEKFDFKHFTMAIQSDSFSTTSIATKCKAIVYQKLPFHQHIGNYKLDLMYIQPRTFRTIWNFDWISIEQSHFETRIQSEMDKKQWMREQARARVALSFYAKKCVPCGGNDNINSNSNSSSIYTQDTGLNVKCRSVSCFDNRD